jgi:general secretion pathway protein C
MNAASWLESFPARDRWRDLLLAHGPKIATWTLALALGVQAALIVTDLAGGTPPAAASPAAAAAVQHANRFVNVAAIANSHLFGRSGPASGTDAKNAPQTTMALVLTGIFAGSDPNVGMAIIGENAASAKLKAVGDDLPGGARLHAVYSDRVLIERNGSIESLELPHQYTAAAAAPPPPQPAAADNAVMERMRRLITDEPGVISDVMRPQAVFAQGKQRGYRVYPGRNRQAFIRLGLRPGDLVTSINGTPLDDPARGEEIFQTIGASSEARVTVLRNGRQQDLTLNMAQLAQEAEQLAGSDGNVPAANDVPAAPEAGDAGRDNTD